MNNRRRKQLETLKQRILKLDAMNNLDEIKEYAINIKDDLIDIQNDEQEYFDNMPENWQEYSLRGQKTECIIEEMEEVIDCIDEIDDCTEIKYIKRRIHFSILASKIQSIINA